MVSDFWLKTVDSLGPKESESGRIRHSRFLKRDILSLQLHGKEVLYQKTSGHNEWSNILTWNVVCLRTNLFVLSLIQSSFFRTLSIPLPSRKNYPNCKLVILELFILFIPFSPDNIKGQYAPLKRIANDIQYTSKMVVGEDLLNRKDISRKDISSVILLISGTVMLS